MSRVASDIPLSRSATATGLRSLVIVQIDIDLRTTSAVRRRRASV